MVECGSSRFFIARTAIPHFFQKFSLKFLHVFQKINKDSLTFFTGFYSLSFYSLSFINYFLNIIITFYYYYYLIIYKLYSLSFITLPYVAFVLNSE